MKYNSFICTPYSLKRCINTTKKECIVHIFIETSYTYFFQKYKNILMVFKLKLILQHMVLFFCDFLTYMV